MKNGKFTREERRLLKSLDAVDEVSETAITYSKDFKRECMRRYHAGERPSEIFASAGLPSSLIGYKRIERAIYHWKEAKAKGALCANDAPQVRHRATVKAEKRKRSDKLAEERKAWKKRERDYLARIAALEAELELLRDRLMAEELPKDA